MIEIVMRRKLTAVATVATKAVARRKLNSSPTTLPITSRLAADAKPSWSALYHSLTLTDTEAYEYRRSSIYKDIGTMYRINNDR